MSSEPLNGLYTNLIVPHGTNLRSNPCLASPMLSSALIQPVVFLRSIDRDHLEFFRYDDWWEHDGLHLPRKDELIDFNILLHLVETPVSIEEAMTGEYKVFIGVAPPSFQWYLRFYHDTDNSGSRYSSGQRTGCFDITLPNTLVDAYRQQVILPLGLEMQTQDSIEYYLSIGMGSYPYSKDEVRKMNEDTKRNYRKLESES